jgi:hypothetical protein
MSHLLLTAAFLLLLSPGQGFSHSETPVQQLLFSNDSVPKSNSIPEDYTNLLDLAMNYQYLADSLTNVADLFRTRLRAEPNGKRAELRRRIAETERLADYNRGLATELMESGSQKQKDTIVRKDASSRGELVVKKQSEIYSMFEIVTDPRLVMP